MRIQGSITATGTMENITEDSRKTVKLATEIKNMLNGMCVNSKDHNSYKKIDEKVQNISIDMNVIKEKLDKIQNIVSNIKCNPHEEGGWTVIQKRYDGSVEFHRNWKDYENGFGDKHGEFWLGNKNIAQLTSEGNHELRIDVEDWDGKNRYAVYRNFSIGDASTKYRLNIGKYSGNAGDGMSYFNGMKFSTYDQDNDKVSSLNCADHSSLKGGWWYNNCWIRTSAMLNGHYTRRNSSIQGIRYRTLGELTQKKSTMKIRKV
ncbi:fibrinogen-like protein A isoform X7 [Mytilus californianus]|uniref:fibrinogen-like protein A isoform X6 n=1 Tax=Mytilus californianus TaxID=6549 RepID=UPI002244FF2A|nr:fibrinogen-like protein A isoform X6 [Mytilus californianus]XP_052106335.1 fibrinogen-like protein A isoform X7 [Mytilus californianus]